MWRAESDPRTSSTGILLEVLDSAPDWPRFVAAIRHTANRFPRLRERIVEPPVPLVQPAWSGVPGFDVKNHLHLVHLGGDASHEELMRRCETTMLSRLDPKRPPWECTLVTGLAGGEAAVLFRFHHSLTDGLGLIQLLALAHATEPADESENSWRRPALPDRPRVLRTVVTPGSLLGSRVAERLRGAPSAAVGQLRDRVPQLRQLAESPLASVRDGAQFVASLGRMLGGPGATGSPLLASRTTGNSFLTLDIDLTELRRAAKAADGSVNDAFVAAVVGGLRRYHEHHDALVDTLPLAMPVSLRQENDPLGGNRFAGVRLAAPLSEPDPCERIRIIREFVLEARDEPAIGFLDHLSPLLTRLPNSAIIELSASLTAASDVQVSNIRGIGHPVYLAGRKVLRTYPLGPRPGVAAMIAMITYDGVCCLGINADPGLDRDLLEKCLKEGFDEVLALGARGRRTSGEAS